MAEDHHHNSGNDPENGVENGVESNPETRKAPRRPRRRRPNGRWSNPASPLQAARFERRKTGQEVVAAIRNLCPGHAGRPCRVDLSKLSDYVCHERLEGV
jgi:hypothetical protein